MTQLKIYHDAILQLAKDAAFTDIPPDANSARLTNPLCGDECALHLGTKDGRIVQVAHHTRGCILTRAAAAQLVQLAQDKPLTEMHALAHKVITAMAENTPLPPPLEIFTPVQTRPSRHGCVILPYQVLLKI